MAPAVAWMAALIAAYVPGITILRRPIQTQPQFRMVASDSLIDHQRSGLRHADTIAALAPSLRPKLAQFGSGEGAELQVLDSILAQNTAYLRNDAEKLRLALEVGYLAHNGQRRKSGEAFITHPVQVASILAEARLDTECVVAGLLHDTVEDTALTFEDLENLFGPSVRRIVEGETKVSKLPKLVRSELARPSKQDEQAENLRSMFVAMAEDWRVVVVKLADRLHNMRTLEYMPVHKRISIARETLEIFAPLAHRLGMWSFRSELADLSFKHLFPAEHDELQSHIDSKMRSYKETLAAATQELVGRLTADPRLAQYRVVITGRTKSIHSTWKKLQRDECSVDEVLDLVALRIVIEPVDSRDGGGKGGGGGGGGGGGELLGLDDDIGGGGMLSPGSSGDDMEICYHVLGKVHGVWTPLPRTLKDYISSPKPNGYRSLHTTVLVGTQPLEVQIRTQQMHRVAEYGAAAHWTYKEKADLDGDGAVFTADRRLADRSAWLQVPALRSIAKWEEELESAHEFMQLVRAELLGTRVFVFTEAAGSNTRILNLAVGATLQEAANALNATAASQVALLNGTPRRGSTKLKNGDIVSFVRVDDQTLQGAPVDEEEGFEGGRKGNALGVLPKLHVCERCLPLPGDAIALTTRSTSQRGDEDLAVGGRLHRAASECLAMRRDLAAGERLVRPTAALEEKYRKKFDDALRPRAPPGGTDEVLATKIIVFTTDRTGLLLTISSVVTLNTVNIVNVRSETRMVGDASAFCYTVHIASVEMLEALILNLEQLDDVRCVLRADMDDLMHDLGPDGFWAAGGIAPIDIHHRAGDY